MQTIGKVQKNTLVEQEGAFCCHLRHKLFLALAVAALLFAGFCVAVSPSAASAKSYTMPKVDIEAEAATDGTLNVVEQRTFDFTGTFSAVWWTFDGLPDNTSLKVNSVQITGVDSNGEATGETRVLSEEAFVLSWRDSGGPAGEAYSLDLAQDTIYVFFSATDERLIMTLDYTFVNGVQAYKDMGEVYWKFIGDQWAEASSNVSMNLRLPAPAGAAISPGETVYAWGHGPLDASVVINEDGSVTYTTPFVSAGQYAEARVLFPVSWLTDLSEESRAFHGGQTRLDTALKEEQGWADQANRDRIKALALIIGCALIAAVIILWTIRSYFKHGKEYQPDFTEQYWRDVPSPQDHPAVIGRLWRWNKESPDDFTATLMHLSHIGAIQVNKGSYEKPGVFGSKMVDDYYLTRVPAVANALTDPIDREAMDMLFKEIAKGEDSLWFGSIEKFGKDEPQSFVDMMTGWQGKVSAETNKRDFFEIKGERLQGRMVVLAVGLLVVAAALWINMENFFPLIFAVPVAILLFIVASNMPRRSKEGNNLDAKCKALRNWLKDFSALDERPPTDVKVWGEFMVYAYIFGVAKQVMQELRIVVPELFNEDASALGVNYVPWWFWYSTSYGAHGSVMPAAGDLFQTSVSNTMKSAQAAVSATSGGGGFSSGGGFGGGFSGGGGGGFGGGGGAR